MTVRRWIFVLFGWLLLGLVQPAHASGAFPDAAASQHVRQDASYQRSERESPESIPALAGRLSLCAYLTPAGRAYQKVGVRFLSLLPTGLRLVPPSRCWTAVSTRPRAARPSADSVPAPPRAPPA